MCQVLAQQAAAAHVPDQRPGPGLHLLQPGHQVLAQVSAALDQPFVLDHVEKEADQLRLAIESQVADHVEPPAVGLDALLDLIERRRQRYLGNRQRADVAGRTAIVIDDGVATGATTRTALRATRMRKPKRLVLAVPVAPTHNLAALRADADDVVCLEDHEFFGAIGFYYLDFAQVSDEEVIKILEHFPVKEPEKAPQTAA